jgi:hypothetical protein
MSKVNFLIVGVQKGGTTALDNYIREHPEVCMADYKEVHFFDNEDNFAQEPDYGKYHENFKFDPTQKKLYGEVTPIYSYWDNAIKRIYQYNNEMKIIIILRNPILRAFSHWNMELGRGLDSLNFYDAILTERERTREALPDKHRVYSYIDRGYYSEQIRNIYRYFRSENVCILFHEDLEANYFTELNKLCDFLDIKPFDVIEERRVFQTKYFRKMRIKEHKVLCNAFKYEIATLADMLQKDLSHWKKIKTKKVLFYRNYLQYQGGHQKVYDYYCHFKSHPYFDVDIVFSKESIFDETNPWKNEIIKQTFDLNEYDIFFIAGEDWRILKDFDYSNKTVINLIQGFRHSIANTFLFECLQNKAIRITVSDELFKTMEATNQLNGSLYNIPNGINIENSLMDKKYDFYILGIKNRQVAQLLTKRLKTDGYKVICTLDQTTKENIHINMAKSIVAITLPLENEGFYLPALEAMALSEIVIVPDCIGNRSFCFDTVNCLMPDYDIDMLYMSAIDAYRKYSLNESKSLKENALKTVKEHSLHNEREKFYKILDDLEYE